MVKHSVAQFCNHCCNYYECNQHHRDCYQNLFNASFFSFVGGAGGALLLLVTISSPENQPIMLKSFPHLIVHGRKVLSVFEQFTNYHFVLIHFCSRTSTLWTIFRHRTLHVRIFRSRFNSTTSDVGCWNKNHYIYFNLTFGNLSLHTKINSTQHCLCGRCLELLRKISISQSATSWLFTLYLTAHASTYDMCVPRSVKETMDNHNMKIFGTSKRRTACWALVIYLNLCLHCCVFQVLSVTNNGQQ